MFFVLSFEYFIPKARLKSNTDLNRRKNILAWG